LVFQNYVFNAWIWKGGVMNDVFLPKLQPVAAERAKKAAEAQTDQGEREKREKVEVGGVHEEAESNKTTDL
jgi:hypothetical protein